MDQVSEYINSNYTVLLATCAAVATTTLLAYIFLKPASAPQKKAAEKPRKLTLREQIDAILDEYEQSYLPGITSLFAGETPKGEQQTYQCNYFQEWLLKLLIKLDGVDLVSESDPVLKNELKLKRKGAIKEIQLKLNELDQFKKNL